MQIKEDLVRLRQNRFVGGELVHAIGCSDCPLVVEDLLLHTAKVQITLLYIFLHVVIVVPQGVLRLLHLRDIVFELVHMLSLSLRTDFKLRVLLCKLCLGSVGYHQVGTKTVDLHFEIATLSSRPALCLRSVFPLAKSHPINLPLLGNQ